MKLVKVNPITLMQIKKRTQQQQQQLQHQQQPQKKQQQQQVLPSGLAPLPRPSTSGGFIVSNKQLQNPPQQQQQQGQQGRQRQYPNMIRKGKQKSQLPPTVVPNQFMYANGNILPAVELNPITIRKIQPGAAHDLNIAATALGGIATSK